VPTGDQEVVIMLHDFSFRPSEEIFAELTGGTGMMDHGMMDPDSQMDMGQGGMDHGAMDQGVEMPGMGHLNDVTYDAYLANDRTLDDPEIVPVEAGGNVRLRLINGAASTNFWIDLGGIEGEVVAIDGSNCRGQDGGPQPRGRLFPLAISQRIDIRLSRLPPGAHPIIARREGDTAQTGIILATPGAAIAQLPSQAASAAPALTLDLERRAAAYIKFDLRAADRRLKLDLTGSMLGFIWSLNGRKFGTHQPLAVREGELVEIEMINRTGMSHPMHLHSHTFRVVEIDGRRIDGPMRDTVLVPVDSSITIAFEADNPGRWAFHCHNLYHMAAGMMTTVEYEA
jgi:FtsP/CotA-like multicopper oxidase with cupredoxin domain